MTETLATLYKVFDYVATKDVEGLIKIAVITIALTVLIKFLWPIIQSFGKVYDITLINRMADDCKFSTLRAQVGDIGVRGAKDNRIRSNETHHYQVVPAWKDVLRSSTLHIKIELSDSNSVIIPVYNKGDIQRSRVFFIEAAGVREVGTTEGDAWVWCREHKFGQQGN
jgi:hypothetical protein